MTKKDYICIFNEIINQIIKLKPDYLFISCGFDAHEDDNMSNLMFDDDMYVYFSKKIKELQIPTIYFLEGGYVPEVIYRNIKNIIDINID
jgi:acetoin utilization deacetylase AcuC-like enzyme